MAVLGFRLWTVANGPFFWCRFGREWQLVTIKRDGMAEFATGRGRFRVRCEVERSRLLRTPLWDSDEGYSDKWAYLDFPAPGKVSAIFASYRTSNLEALKDDVLSIVDRTAGPYRGLEGHEIPPSRI